MSVFLGTVVINKTLPVSGARHLSLILKGEGFRSTPLKTGPNVTFNEVHIYEKASVDVENDLTILQLHGDGTGAIKVSSQQTLQVAALKNPSSGAQCNFVVDAGATLLLPAEYFHTAENPLLDVSGTLQATSLTMDKNAKLYLRQGAALRVKTLILWQRAQIDIASGTAIGVGVTKGYSLTELEVGSDGKLTFTDENITIAASTFTMHAGAVMTTRATQKTFNIQSDTLSIQDDAVINVSGGGLLDGSGKTANTKQGASHGGEGGQNPGTTYGSTTAPSKYGSGTGSVRGGGVIMLQASRTMVLNGKLSAAGGAGTSSGGGSGGSIQLKAGTLEGHGTVSVEGGDGGPSSCGGGGGRIAIVATTGMADFIGSVLSHGGGSSASLKCGGASGTQFYHYKEFGIQKYKFEVSNNDVETDEKTIASEMGTGTYANINLGLKKHAKLVFSSTASQSFRVQQVYGDYTGTIFVQSGQQISIAVSYGIQHSYALSCGVHIAKGAVAELSPKLLLTGTGKRQDANIHNEGTLKNVRQLTVGTDAKVVFSGTSNTADASSAQPAGSAYFSRIDITDKGLLELGVQSANAFTVDALEEFTVHFGGVVRAKNLKLTAPKLNIAYNGTLSSNNLGYAAATGPGAGQGTSTGSGGSLGGAGGSSSSGSAPLVSQHGSVFTATTPGSGGGAGGGAGGGVLDLVCSQLCRLEGILSANGEAGTASGGGGAGGSIRVKAKMAVGAGEFFVKGGAGGAAGGGGGGGGRVVIDVQESSNYSAQYHTSGGNAGSPSAQSGGGGTAYVNKLVKNNAFKVNLF